MSASVRLVIGSCFLWALCKIRTVQGEVKRCQVCARVGLLLLRGRDLLQQEVSSDNVRPNHLRRSLGPRVGHPAITSRCNVGVCSLSYKYAYFVDVIAYLKLVRCVIKELKELKPKSVAANGEPSTKLKPQFGSAARSSTKQLLFQEDLNFEDCCASYSIFSYHNAL